MSMPEAHLATYISNSTFFTHADWLGTERVRSTAAGGPPDRAKMAEVMLRHGLTPALPPQA
jgi:hypothetical protein